MVNRIAFISEVPIVPRQCSERLDVVNRPAAGVVFDSVGNEDARGVEIGHVGCVDATRAGGQQ